MSNHPESRMLTGGGDFERYTFAGACNEPTPGNWKTACRRRAGHGDVHHTWDPRTGTQRRRHPLPYSGIAGEIIATVDAWHAGSTGVHSRRMLAGSAYVAPVETDRLMIEAILRRETAHRLR